MKKILLATALTLSVAQTTFATGSAYNGWAAGASVGYSSTSLKLKFLDDVDAQAAAKLGVKTKTKNNSAVFGLHADWHNSMSSRLYFGFGLGLGSYTGTSKTTLYEGTPTGATATKVAFKYNRGIYGDLTARLGMSVNKAIIYGLLTVRGTKVKAEYISTSNTRAYNFTEKKSGWDMGFGPGLGFDVKVAEKVSVGAEYRYLFGKALTMLDSDDKSKFLQFKSGSHNLGLRVSYHF